MGMAVGPAEGEDEAISAINTTPLVDVMLVLLIIFLITIPVVTQSVALQLPEERNVPRQTAPENIEISVTRDGDVFWGMQKLRDNDELFGRLKEIATKQPQPEVQIRGDLSGRYEHVGRVVFACQRAGIQKVGFVTEPPSTAAGR
jgi:biopolymer transport protein ExbD